MAGIIGGMGMGGGTVLVPLLSFLDLEQKVIQGINLISFLPMCLVALALHFKKGLVKPKNILYIVIPAVVFAVVGAFFASDSQNKILRIAFALFLIAVGSWQLVVAVRFQLRKAKRKVVVFAPTKYLLAKGRKVFFLLGKNFKK